MNDRGQRAAATEATRLRRGLGICLILAGLLIAHILLPRASHAIDSVSEELQRIVVLCATEPGSPRFDRAWTGWVDAHPEADLEETIQMIISRAKTLRSMGLSGLEPTPPKRAPSSRLIADHMRALVSSARLSGRAAAPATTATATMSPGSPARHR